MPLAYLLFLYIFLGLAGNMALSAGTLKVTTPNGGESWTAGKKYAIKWKRGNGGSYVKIELLRSGKVYKTVSVKTKNDGKYRWKVPSSVTTSKRYKIKVTSSTKEDRSDSSNKKFTIKKLAITTSSGGSDVKVTSPNGGESWEQGSTYTIKWETGDVTGKVMIELRAGSGTSASTALEIVAETKNDGSYSWKIPTTVDTGSNYEIRISPGSGDTKDASNKNFSITETTSLKLRSSAFKSGGEIPEKYTCDGNEASPPLTISGVPKGAKELVLFLDDLDGTPTATNTTTDWNHWVVTNISVKKGNFRDYRIPTRAVAGLNDSSESNYDPICPPGEKGDREKHNYQFTLYAVDEKVTNNSSTRAEVKTAIDGSILAKKTLKGYFGG
jgi:Raf kinase inhibitor-like YbhB/YbcL family protein